MPLSVRRDPPHTGPSPALVSPGTMTLVPALHLWANRGCPLVPDWTVCLETLRPVPMALPERLRREHPEHVNVLATLAGLAERAALLLAGGREADRPLGEHGERIVHASLARANARVGQHYAVLLLGSDPAWKPPPHGERPSGSIRGDAVRRVIERAHDGQLLRLDAHEALALLPSADLLPVARRLHECVTAPGVRAGLVVADAVRPLGEALREARRAARSAAVPASDGFTLATLERTGGVRHFSAPWGSPLELLDHARRLLAVPELLNAADARPRGRPHALPVDDPADLLDTLRRRLLISDDDIRPATQEAVDTLARTLAIAVEEPIFAGRTTAARRRWLEKLLAIAELLARESGRA